MITSTETKVLTGEDMTWTLIPDHVHLYHKEIVNAAAADSMGIRLSSILWEQIGVGGAVLPHFHDVAEVIHITKGKVKLLCNGEWKYHKAGDTFHVPAGTVHSVANDDISPTEQISIFMPADNEAPANHFFRTFLVDDIHSKIPVKEQSNA
ncbi:MAG TPA: cupin domain-containing protein [Bacilli bacterium]